jgi:hypothetical protein
MACPNSTLCVAGDDSGNVVVSTSPTGGATAWTVSEQVDPGAQITGLACPAPNLCVAVGSTGDVAVSTHPAAGARAWKLRQGVVSPADGLRGVACANRSFCVALDARGDVLTTQTPTGGPHAWKLVRVLRRARDHLVSIACPTRSLCVAIDRYGTTVAHSIRPGAGAASWHLTRIATSSSTDGTDSIACPSPSLCAIVGVEGNVITTFVATSTHPTGGRAAWHVDTHLKGPTGYLTSLSCPSTHFCLAAGDGYGSPAYYSTNPTGGAQAWRPAVAPAGGAAGGACASALLCVLFDSTGDVLASTKPTSAAASDWPVSTVDAYNSLTSVACPSAALCLAGGSEQQVLSTANPAGGASAWTGQPVAIVPARLACASATLCVAGDARSGNLAATTTPLAGGWSVAGTDSYLPDGGTGIAILACAPGPFCLAGPLEIQSDADLGGTSALTSTNPAAGKAAWAYSGWFIEGGINGGRRPAGGTLSALACPAATLCVGGVVKGGILATTHPRGNVLWPYSRVDGSAAINALACPTPTLCVAVDSQGRALTSTDPVSGHWRRAAIDNGLPLTGVSCATAHFCVAVDGTRHAFIATDPTAGRRAWIRSPGVGGDLTAIACPTNSLCVAADSQGSVTVGRR